MYLIKVQSQLELSFAKLSPPSFFDISDNVLGYVNEEIPPDKMVQNEYITRMTSDRGSQCGAVLVAVNEVGFMISYISKMTGNNLLGLGPRQTRGDHP